MCTALKIEAISFPKEKMHIESGSQTAISDLVFMKTLKIGRIVIKYYF